jgi:hypothetical protein
VEKKNKQLKFLWINQSHKELNINSHDDLINLQKGIIYKLTAITILHLTVLIRWYLNRTVQLS